MNQYQNHTLSPFVVACLAQLVEGITQPMRNRLTSWQQSPRSTQRNQVSSQSTSDGVMTMRKIERQIVQAVRTIRNGDSVRLSERDNVACHTVDDCEVVQVRLHSTYIATINRTTNTVTLNTGGWHTTTTKSRLNAILREFCGLCITQKNYNWTIGSFLTGSTFTTRDYDDGMIVPCQNSRWDGEHWVAC